MWIFNRAQELLIEAKGRESWAALAARIGASTPTVNGWVSRGTARTAGKLLCLQALAIPLAAWTTPATTAREVSEVPRPARRWPWARRTLPR